MVSTFAALAIGLGCSAALVGCGDSGRGETDSAGGTANQSGGGISITLTDDDDDDDDDDNDDDDDGGTGGATGGMSTTGTSNASNASNSSNDSGSPKFDLAPIPDLELGCGDGIGGGGNDIDESFIWVPNTNEGSVNKIDTRTLIRVAKYRVGPTASESSSRTAVSGDGRFVVINNRGTGRSTAVAANIADCVDKNNDGVITTSQNGDDLLAWDADECVLWSVVHAWGGSQQHGPRGITWTLGDWNEATCSYENAKVWLGYMAGGGNAHIVKLNGQTGRQEELIVVPGWNGQGYAPYGGALDPQGRPWFTGLRGELVRVNVQNNPVDVTRISQPSNIQTYGMTVDPNGNPWMAGCSGPVSTYDIQSGQWISVAGTSACHRGMAVDQNGHAWVASNGPCEIVEIDTETRTLVAKHQPPQCSTAIGVSVDVDGYVWVVDQSGWAYKIDPMNVPAMQYVEVPGYHYVYSDMTGGQLKSVAPPLG